MFGEKCQKYFSIRVLKYQFMYERWWSPVFGSKHLDQVEGEGWVDKNAALRGWAFFTSYVCKL